MSSYMVPNRHVMPRPKSPCYGCEDRKVGCHSVCDKYIQFHEARIAESKHLYFTNKSAILANDYLSKEKLKYTKRRGQ